MLLPKLQHVVPAALLLYQGISRLMHERHGWSLLLAAAEVVVSVLVTGAFLRQVRAARSTRAVDGHEGHASHGVDWVDVLIGAMLGVEVWAHWHETGHIKRPTVLTAVGIFAVGLLHGQIAARAGRRQVLTIDDAGIAVGGRPFQKFRATWDELAAVEIDSGEGAAGAPRRQGPRLPLQGPAQRRRRPRGAAGREAARDRHRRSGGRRGRRPRRQRAGGPASGLARAA